MVKSKVMIRDVEIIVFVRSTQCRAFSITVLLDLTAGITDSLVRRVLIRGRLIEGFTLPSLKWRLSQNIVPEDGKTWSTQLGLVFPE